MTLFAALSLLALSSALAQETVPAAAPTNDVVGSWSVDLRVSAADPAYSQPMHLNVDADGKVTGDFYNSVISSGRYGRNMGCSCVAFVTSDGVGDYQHSACLVDGRMVGQSWAEHRGFVLPWTAVRGE
jgi:hypothetical protein